MDWALALEKGFLVGVSAMASWVDLGFWALGLSMGRSEGVKAAMYHERGDGWQRD